MKTSELKQGIGAAGTILAVYLFLLCSSVWAQVPSSRQIPFSGVTTTILPGTTGQTLTMRVLDNSNPPVALYCESQTLDVDSNGAITFNLGAGTAANPPCPSAPPGLNPTDFASGSTRSLDVVDTNGNSVLNPPVPIPLTAVAFALSPGPTGPAGPKGDKGDTGSQGQQGPPGVVQAITPGDASITVAGTAATPSVAVSPNGITNSNIGNGALSPAKITGTAATLGPNNFIGTQSINGALALPNTTSGGTGLLSLGGVRFLHNYGSDTNTFLGSNAGNLTMTGNNNTGVGSIALKSNTTACCNTAVGNNALWQNTTGAANTAVGDGALYTNSTGVNNTAIGRWALISNSTGHENTAVGVSSLQNSATGFENTAIGYQALYANTGSNNTAAGANALVSNTTGHENTATGVGTLFGNTTGANNTASGYEALFNNTTGGGNTANGAYSLIFNTTGSNNTGTGASSLQYNTTGYDNTATGVQALFVSTTGYGNTAAGKQTLNTNTTGSLNTATGYLALSSNNGNDNVATGFRSVSNNTAGNGNTGVGDYTLQTNTSGSFNTAVGFSADVSAGNLTNATAIGNGAVVNGSNKIRLGNGAVTVIEGQVAYTFSSDKNKKENFEPVKAETVLAKLAHLRVSSWNYIGQDPKQFRHYGPMAQDFFAAFGHDRFGTVGTDTTINSGDMAGILMIGVQGLQKRTTKIQHENATLRSKLEQLRLENAALQATVQQSHRQMQDLLRQVKLISQRLDAPSTAIAQSRR